jgi:hypothetical protein
MNLGNAFCVDFAVLHENMVSEFPANVYAKPFLRDLLLRSHSSYPAVQSSFRYLSFIRRDKPGQDILYNTKIWGEQGQYAPKPGVHIVTKMATVDRNMSGKL